MAERLERETKHWGKHHLLRMTVYMINDKGHIRICFPGTHPEEVIDFIRSMESQGYYECGWVRWFWKKCWLQIKCWVNWRAASKVNIQGQRGLTINIGE